MPSQLSVGLLACVAMSISVAACASRDHSSPDGSDAADATEAQWKEKLDELQSSNAAALYSMVFVAPPPGGARYAVSVHLRDRASACAAEGGEVEDDTGDRWSLRLEFGKTGVGTYSIRKDLPGDDAFEARATVYRHRNGELVHEFRAVGGTVDVTEGPPIEEARDGSVLRGRVSLTFPTTPWETVECRGGVASDGSQRQSYCTCRDMHGRELRCDSDDGRSCCADQGGDLVEMAFPLEASACPSMCRVVVGLPFYCTLVGARP